MSERNLKQVDILQNAQPYCKKYGVKLNKNDLSQYVSGKVEPGQHKLYILGLTLNVSEAWLMGYDVPMERTPFSEVEESPESLYEKYDNIHPIHLKKFPMLGKIACGEPIYADEDRESFVMADMDIKADFCLTAKGDSMINARIYDGDVVFIKEMPMVENGEIAAVIIEDEATLKRVYYYPEDSTLQLIAENPRYKPLIYQNEELNRIRVLGKAVYFMSAL
jgi:repressor LexA